MYKNQLQELAQRSCFNLPSYSCIREGPDHAPRFKASVIFNGEIFECPNYCSTLRQAEHAAAEVALNALSSTGPAKSLTARVLDETGVYKNLLQETAHRAGLNLPVYTTVRSGPGHLPVFTCAVNIANMNFTGISAKTKKQAEKNAAIAAWSALKRMSISDSVSQSNKQMSTGEVEEQLVVSRVLSRFKPRDEGKNVRRWDNNRSRKGMIRCYRDNNNTGSSSTSMKSTLFHQIKSMDPVMERSFLNLLPPPPPRTISKILPALSSSPSLPRDSTLSHSPLQSDLPLPEVKITSQVKIHNVSTVMQEHQKDEEEWLGIKDNNLFKKQPTAREEIANPSSSYKPKLFPVHDIEKLITSISKYTSQQSEKSHIRTNLFALPNPIIKSPIARPVYTGGFQRLAPAVHIRSVIPVCAAPPQPSKPIVREATTHSVPTAASTFISSQTRTEEISSIESKLEKLEL